MKRIFKSRCIMSALIAALFFSAFSMTGVTTPTAAAATIEKPFEIGAGTAQPRSHFRTFNVPSELDVTATVTYYRLGDAGAQHDVQITIELRQPGATASEEGPLVDQKTVTAKRVDATGGRAQSVTLQGQDSVRGCALPWRVRVRSADGSNPPVAIKGNITVGFNTNVGTITFDRANNFANLNLPKGNKQRKRLFGIRGSGQVQIGSSTVRIRAEWHTSPLELFHINSYYKLTVSLIRNGSPVFGAGRTAFSQHAPADKTPKLDFTHFISPEQAAGATWEIEIESSAPADIVDFHINESGGIRSTFTPGCN